MVFGFPGFGNSPMLWFTIPFAVMSRFAPFTTAWKRCAAPASIASWAADTLQSMTSTFGPVSSPAPGSPPATG